ncbi:MAG: hypothetical protein AB7Y46_20415 [Armatimonadota bacterium]
MTLRTLVAVLLVGLTAMTVGAQALTEPPGPGPKPAMIVGGRALTPAVFAEGLEGETVRLDAVEMLWVGAAAKAAGGSAVIEATPEGKMLRVSAGMRTMEFVILPPGEFWRHPWVRRLIADASIMQLQPLPPWPYEEANIPPHPPHTVNWKRPYLDWKPDEAWLLLHLEPPPPEEPALIVLEEEEEEEEAEAAPAAPTPAAPAAGPPGMPGMEPGMAPPAAGAPGAEPGMIPEPPPPAP